jgi:hypothetical protein
VLVACTDDSQIDQWAYDFSDQQDVLFEEGYKEITDQMRANILGLNLAKLAGIEPTRRVGKGKGKPGALAS